MKLKFLLALSGLLFTFGGHAQENDSLEPQKRGQAFYFEGFGSGLIMSFNYDTRFNKRNDGIGGRIGASYFALDHDGIFTLPVNINYLLGNNGHYFELGAGATFLSIKNERSRHPDDYDETNEVLVYSGKSQNVLGNLTFGYRRQPINSGFSFRAGFSPVFFTGNFIPYWPHVSFGYKF